MSTASGEYPYLDYFNLQRAPFTPLADDRFLFTDAAIEQRLEMLRHVTGYSDLLLIISGEQGSGKSTLARQFIASVRGERRVCRVDASYGMDTRALLAGISEGFAFPAVAADAEGLEDLLRGLRNGRRHLLVIDDAHRLPVEALTFLLQFAARDSGKEKLLDIVLFCEPSISELLAVPAVAPLRDRHTQTMEMPRFSEEQTAAYLRFRMEAAGAAGEFPFSDKLVRMIHRGSHGSPARINELAHRALMEISGAQPRSALAALLAQREVWLPLGIAAAVALIGLLLLSLPDDESQPRREEEQLALPAGTGGEEAVRQEERAAEPSVPPAVGQHEPEPVAQARVTSAPESRPDAEGAAGSAPRLKGWPADDQPPAAPAHGETGTAPVAEPAAAAPAPGAPVIEEVLPDPVPASRERQEVILRGSGFQSGSRVSLGWTGRVKELAPEQVKVESPERIRISIVTGSSSDTWTARVTNPDGRSSATHQFRVEAAEPTRREPASPPAAEEGVAGIRREAWLRRQDPNHYTVQLMGSSREADIATFVRRHRLKGELAYFRGLSQGKDWYSLVAGVYPDFQAANRAAAQLARKVPGISPWVRRIGNIRILLEDLESAPPETVSPPRLPRDEQDVAWLLEQNPRHYTVQLVAGRDRNTIRQFIRSHGPADNAVYFRTIREGRAWYALVYNSYRSRSEAAAALARLPRAWRKYRPWVRSFASIQQELRRSGTLSGQ